MKAGIFTALFCLLAPLAVPAAEEATDAPVNPTAYTAMRLVQKQIGGDALSRIVEIVGRDGSPQPFLWKVILKESAGVREVDVTEGKIAAQRVVIGQSATASLPPIKLQDLNLDSSGAFDAADAQARKARVRFDSLNYTLRASEVTGKPLWSLDLLDKDGASVGTMRLAAHDGTTLNIEGRLARTVGPTESPARGSGGGLANSTTQPPVIVQGEEIDEESSGFFTRAGRTIDKTNRTVQRHLRKAGTTVQKFFTGHGDSDQPDE